MADGGEGTVAAMVAATGGRLITRTVTGPLPDMKVSASFGFLGDEKTAVIEMSAASGLALLKIADRNPLNTTTFGTGELIRAAIEEGAKTIILGIGGSATNDAGIGCAQACGFTVLLKDGEPTSMTEPLCGRDLENVLMVKHGRGEVTGGVEIVVACDVTNPLLGPTGAAHVFGPQKGALPESIQWLDDQLRSLVERSGTQTEANTPGSGAAGGMGYGMLAFFGAKLKSGFDLIANASRLKDRIAHSDLCITGEGRLDGQSADGKTVSGVARLCQQANVPCIAIAGSIGNGADKLLALGLTDYFVICDADASVEESIRHAKEFLRDKTAAYFRQHGHSKITPRL